jgi:hypothetical protein
MTTRMRLALVGLVVAVSVLALGVPAAQATSEPMAVLVAVDASDSSCTVAAIVLDGGISYQARGTFTVSSLSTGGFVFTCSASLLEGYPPPGSTLVDSTSSGGGTIGCWNGTENVGFASWKLKIRPSGAVAFSCSI